MGKLLSCAMMGLERPESFCAGLVQLMDEHAPLRERMDEFYQAALAVEQAPGENKASLAEQLRGLQRLIAAFEAELIPHSEREEHVLFPLMAHYLGRVTGPIAVMEQEHELAKRHFADFEQGMEAVGAEVTPQQANRLTNFVKSAYQVLCDHFYKEEQILFPMAETLLEPDEKEQLLEGLQALRKKRTCSRARACLHA